MSTEFSDSPHYQTACLQSSMPVHTTQCKKKTYIGSRVVTSRQRLSRQQANRCNCSFACQNITNRPHQYAMNVTSCTLAPCHVRISQQHKHTHTQCIQCGHSASPLHQTDKTKSLRSCSFSHAPYAPPQRQMLAAVCAWPSQFPSYA
jgi:hypothetical protein